MTPAPSAPARVWSRALDALGEALGTTTWAELRMADVAAAAGVSRQTLYNEFGGRHDLALAYAVREGATFVSAVEGAIVAHADDPRAAIGGAFDLFLGLVRDHPLVREEELLTLLTTEGGPVLEQARERLVEVVLEHFPDTREADARLVADVTVRLAISHAAMPAGAQELAGGSVARVLGPFLDVALGGDRP